MNIISNSCISGEIYRNGLKTEFQNPFIWNRIDNENIVKLIENWDDINFKNYSLNKDKNWNFWITIDNLIQVNYVHYHFDKNQKNNKKSWHTRLLEQNLGIYCR